MNHEGTCAKLCYDSADCAAWSFNMDDSSCSLKRTVDCFVSNPSFVWGTKQCGGIKTKFKNSLALSLSLCFLSFTYKALKNGFCLSVSANVEWHRMT